MNDLSIITDLKERITNIDERLSAIERAERKIIENILSDQPMEYMRRIILEKPKQKKMKIENSNIEI